MPAIAILCAVLTVAALFFFVLGWIGLANWRRVSPPPPLAPPVSILKPLKGYDPEMYAAFRSHGQQEYPASFEIIFGVNTADDEAVPYVELLQAEFPQLPITLLVCSDVLGANRKVSNLLQMLDRVQYRHIIVNDSDITVPPGYLVEVMRWFADPRVGMVTCLYRAKAGMTLWSKLEALGVLADFMPGALAARFLERKVRFGLGATMALDRDALQAIGGLRPLVNHLADDYELGSRICDSGRQVAIAQTVVQTSTPDYSFRSFWYHQMRWGRTVRSSRPGGYLGLFLTFGFLWALLAVAFSRAAGWSLLLLGAVLAARVLTVMIYVRALHDRTSRYFWLIPLRDLISPLVWLLSLGGKRITWRGEEFELSKGKLGRIK